MQEGEKSIVKQPCNQNLLLQIAQVTKLPPFGSPNSRNCHPRDNCISPHLLTKAADATYIEKPMQVFTYPGIDSSSTTITTNTGSNSLIE